MLLDCLGIIALVVLGTVPLSIAPRLPSLGNRAMLADTLYRLLFVLVLVARRLAVSSHFRSGEPFDTIAALPLPRLVLGCLLPLHQLVTALVTGCRDHPNTRYVEHQPVCV